MKTENNYNALANPRHSFEFAAILAKLSLGLSKQELVQETLYISLSP